MALTPETVQALNVLRSQIPKYAMPYASGKTRPTPEAGTSVLWHDTENAKYYIVVNFNGTVKKVEAS